MSRPAKPYLHRGHFIANVGRRRHRLCREVAGEGAAWAALRKLLSEGSRPGDRTGKPLSIPQLVERYSRHREGKIDPKNWVSQKVWLERFAQKHQGVLARDLTLLAVEAYIDDLAASTWTTRGRREKPYKPRTINHVLAALRQMFLWAVERELVPSNPWQGVRPLACDDRERVMTDEEWLALMRHSGPHFRRVLLVLRYTSMRTGELRKLTWSNVDWRNERFVIHRHKTSRRTGKPRVVPYPDCVGKLLRWLGARQDTSADALVFRNSWGRPWSDDHLAGYMDIVRNRAGLRPDANGERLTLYHHRHRFLTEAASAHGIDGTMLQRLAGHESLTMTMRYAHLSGGTVSKAAALVADTLRRSAPATPRPGVPPRSPRSRPARRRRCGRPGWRCRSRPARLSPSARRTCRGGSRPRRDRRPARAAAAGPARRS